MPAARVAPVTDETRSSRSNKVSNGYSRCPNGLPDDTLSLIKSSAAPSTIEEENEEDEGEGKSERVHPPTIACQSVFAQCNSPFVTTNGHLYLDTPHCTALSYHVEGYTQASKTERAGEATVAAAAVAVATPPTTTHHKCTLNEAHSSLLFAMETSEHRKSKNHRHRQKGVRRLSIPGFIDIKCQTYTPYEKIMKSLTSDVNVQREILLGRRIGFYRIKGQVGTGNFSQVKIAVHCLTKEKAAIKILDKSKLDVKTQRMLTREIYCMEKLHHPNLVRLFEVIETLSKVYLVMEYASSGELAQRISDKGRLKESTSAVIFAQIVSAIDHMHQHHIIHRDIKAENVFFADNDTVKVGDFGFSTQVKNANDLLNTFCGSPPYAAPELFSDENYVGPSVDLWALGVLLYYMVTGSMPFKASTVTGLKELICQVNYIIPEYISKDCSTIIIGLLQSKPEDRISISDLRTSKWLRGQHFPNSLPKYRVSDRINGNFIERASSSLSLGETGSKLSSEEREAQRLLRQLGIDEELLLRNKDKGLRSNIIGTYRILLHRVINQKYTLDNYHFNSNRVTPFNHMSINDYPYALDDDAKLHKCIQAGGHELGSLLKILTGKVDDDTLPVWPEERIFVDSEGFIIPDALVHLETDRSVKLQHQQLLQQHQQQYSTKSIAMSDQSTGVNCQGDKWFTQVTTFTNGNSTRDTDVKWKRKNKMTWKNRPNTSFSSSSSSTFSKRYFSSNSCILF